MPAAGQVAGGSGGAGCAPALDHLGELLAGALAAGAVASLWLTLAASVRRRAGLALLKTVIAGALATANLVAAIHGRTAARTSAAALLRAE